MDSFFRIAHGILARFVPIFDAFFSYLEEIVQVFLTKANCLERNCQRQHVRAQRLRDHALGQPCLSGA